MPWSYSYIYIEILCHDICILTIPKVHTGLLDVVSWSNPQTSQNGTGLLVDNFRFFPVQIGFLWFLI
ncbi:dna replication complex gins psf1 [Gossypium arboreum]|uniref:Dna replication complex gins psf1 n=1 Tax=Gossypium arboreum TaxID=29729 RepID=A0A0B0MBY6_GOSAR|nr:dna replication complex gins psf1 [Gossypium arboreum]